MKQPIIGILARLDSDTDDYVLGYEKAYVSTDDIEVIRLAGGIPIILPVVNDYMIIQSYINLIDGLLVPGGGDINPLLFNEEPIKQQGFVIKEIDEFDIKAIKFAFKKRIPILGICRGMQIMNVAFGGTIYQDLSQIKDSYINHFQKARKDFENHTVLIEPNTKLYSIFCGNIITNSFHHQAVRQVAPNFKVCGISKDGVIEAIEATDNSFMLGVQWHPEMMYKTNSKMLNLLKIFIQEASKNISTV
jgi:putative glutamine amidotransferase